MICEHISEPKAAHKSFLSLQLRSLTQSHSYQLHKRDLKWFCTVRMFFIIAQMDTTLHPSSSNTSWKTFWLIFNEFKKSVYFFRPATASTNRWATWRNGFECQVCVLMTGKVKFSLEHFDQCELWFFRLLLFEEHQLQPSFQSVSLFVPAAWKLSLRCHD